ncbi:hypothetical protein BGZ67_007214 [Mortierella alpina]|nr:hypothetical protein BGZ67_007214 [Mortierella alpina]
MTDPAEPASACMTQGSGTVPGTMAYSASSSSSSSSHSSHSSACVAANKVFHIPELADSIALYLRPVYISQLRLVSRALYAAYRPYLRLHLHRGSTASWTSFPHPLQTTRDHADEDGQDVSDQLSEEASCPPVGYAHLVRTITTDTMDNLEIIRPLLLAPQQCPNLHTLVITRWNRDLCVFIDLLGSLPKLQSLSVSFYVSVDLNCFLKNITSPSLSSTSSSSTTSSPGESVAAPSGSECPVSMAAAMIAATADDGVEGMKGGLLSLRSLDIKHRVPDINYIRWRVFLSALDALPALRELSLTGIGLRGGDDSEDAILGQVAQGPIHMTTVGIVAPFNGGINVGPAGPHGVDSAVDLLGPGSLEQANQTRSRAYPQMRSLTLAFGECPSSTMQDLDRIFPNLSSLELNKCRNNWLQAFEPDVARHLHPLHLQHHHHHQHPPPYQQQQHQYQHHFQQQHLQQSIHQQAPATKLPSRPIFPHLTHLKLIDRHEGHQDLLFEIIKARPLLTSLETQDVALNLETLMSVASFCAKEGRMMQRLSLAPFWSLAQTRGFEKLYEAPFLSQVRHLYIQQELSENIQFASTLTSLHIDAGFNDSQDFECDCSPIPVWNAVLRRLPELEVLRIDRFITDYSLFEGLGRTPPLAIAPSNFAGEGDALCTGFAKGVVQEDQQVALEGEINGDTDSSDLIHPRCGGDHDVMDPAEAQAAKPSLIEDWSQERPFLHELQITFRDACQVQTKDLDRELIQRFRFLERLCFACYKRPEDLEEAPESPLKSMWRPGLVVEHRRYLNK